MVLVLGCISSYFAAVASRELELMQLPFYGSSLAGPARFLQFPFRCHRQKKFSGGDGETETAETGWPRETTMVVCSVCLKFVECVYFKLYLYRRCNDYLM